MNQFIPNNSAKIEIPYFDRVTSKDGWEGHTTGKSVEKLKQEIAEALSKLGCMFYSIQEGTFGDRIGFRINFGTPSKDGSMIASRMDIACLPLARKTLRRNRKGKILDTRVEGTKKMALYMTVRAIRGMYYLSVLSSEYVPFMSMMIGDGSGNTLGRLWSESHLMSNLLPETSSFKDLSDKDGEDIIDGSVS